MSCLRCGNQNTQELVLCPSCGMNIDGKEAQYPIQFFPTVLVALLLIGALVLDYLSIGFFAFQRWVIMLVAMYYAYILYCRNQVHTLRFWMLGIIALLFNPFFYFFLPSRVWQFWELVVSVIIILYGIKLRNRKDLKYLIGKPKII